MQHKQWTQWRRKHEKKNIVNNIMDCLFGFLLLALMLFIFNRYLKIQRDGMSSCDVQNTTINKKTVLRNSATLEMIKDNLAKNMKRFEMFGKDILKNKQDNKNNEMLLETQVKQKEIQMKKDDEEREKIGKGL